MEAKTYVVAKSTYYKDGQLQVQFQLYRRILEDGTDLRWSYNIGRDPIITADGAYNDIENVRQKIVSLCAERGISESDVQYIY